MRSQTSSSRPARPDAETGPNPSLPVLGRREFVALGTGAFLLLSLPRALGGRRNQLVRRTVPARGTVAEDSVGAGFMAQFDSQEADVSGTRQQQDTSASDWHSVAALAAVCAPANATPTITVRIDR